MERDLLAAESGLKASVTSLEMHPGDRRLRMMANFLLHDVTT